MSREGGPAHGGGVTSPLFRRSGMQLIGAEALRAGFGAWLRWRPALWGAVVVCEL